MKAVEVKKDIYWVGAIDWSLRSFHGYTTQKGSTYNAYLIMDEKITLIDTVKAGFSEELLERVSQIVDPAKIDYLISNHVEPDHSGAIPAVMKAAPNAKLVTVTPQGVKGLTAYYGEYDYMPVKGGDVLSIGKRTLQFVPTPMLHWPDNMVTYCPEEKILFSNDAFGAHYASSGRFDDEVPFDEVMEQALKYYANIVMPYATQVKAAYKVVSELPIEIIAPSHGIIWRKHIAKILDRYVVWSSDACAENAIVVFDSMWHSTEMMARTISETFASKGIAVKLIDLKETHISDIMSDVLLSKYIAVGSPTLNNHMLPTVAGFLSYLSGLTPKSRKALAFGSYGWSGQSIGEIEDALKACGYEMMCDKMRQLYKPTDEQLAEMEKTVSELL